MGPTATRARAVDGGALDRALARSDAYRELAAAFRDPDDPNLESRPQVRILRAAVRRLGLVLDAEQWSALGLIARREDRATEHRAIFGHVVAHGCPPYETEFGRRHVFGQSQELGDIRGFYEAFGVRPRAGGERPDHIACELEFLALLSLKEALALAGDDDDRRQLCRRAQRLFLQDHPARWVRALAAQIAMRAPSSGYAATAAVAATILADHATAVGAIPAMLDPDDLVPIREEPDGFTFECGVDVDAGDLAPPGSVL